MDFGISTQFYRQQQVTVDLLESLRKAGYQRIELFCNRPHIDFHDRKLIRGIGQWFQETRMAAPSIHLPFVERIGTSEHRWISPLDSERRQRETAIDEYKRCLELAERILPEYVVMHLGNPGEPFNPVSFEYAYAAIAEIEAFSGVRIMVENIPNEISTVERLQEFKALAKLGDIGICYDTGHGHLQGMADNLDFAAATHIHDNLGERDDHLWPFEGSIDWPSLIEKLVLAGYSGTLMFEARGDDLAHGDAVKNRLREMWDEAHASIDEFRLRYKLPKPQALEENRGDKAEKDNA